MNINGSKILSELTEVNNQLNTSDIYKLIDLIDISNHIYLTGAGRSGLMIRSFANRLLHLGYNISVVGEISSPHTHPGDLLLISSGSGETKSLISQAEIAKQNGLKVALITTSSISSLAKLADIVLLIPVQSKDTTGETIQPMGTLFEQYTLILYDSIVLNIMGLKNQTNETMKARHANLE